MSDRDYSMHEIYHELWDMNLEKKKDKKIIWEKQMFITYVIQNNLDMKRCVYALKMNYYSIRKIFLVNNEMDLTKDDSTSMTNRLKVIQLKAGAKKNSIEYWWDIFTMTSIEMIEIWNRIESRWMIGFIHRWNSTGWKEWRWMRKCCIVWMIIIRRCWIWTIDWIVVIIYIKKKKKFDFHLKWLL